MASGNVQVTVSVSREYVEILTAGALVDAALSEFGEYAIDPGARDLLVEARDRLRKLLDRSRGPA